MAGADIGLDVRPPLRYLSATDVTSRLDLASVVESVRTAFLANHRDSDEQPQRLALGAGELLVMASRRRAERDAVVKVLRVNTDGKDSQTTPATIDGVLLWLGGMGEPILAIDAGSVTALRTAAIVALATDLLADPAAKRLAILGAGRQAREQGPAVALVRPLTDIVVWNRTQRRADALAEHLAATMQDVSVRVADHPFEAVKDADIVCCATAATEPLFAASVLDAGAHVNAIGSYRPDMHEFSSELLGKASIIAVDSAAACLVEAGEIIDAVGAGVIGADALRELADLLTQPPARRGLTVFKSVGVALADFAVAAQLAATV